MKGEVYNPSTSIVLKAAHLHFTEKKSQKEIAALLNISPATVSRLLKRAETEGIVSFVFAHPYSDCLQLEQKLTARYGLTEAVVVPPAEDPNASDEDIKKMVALEGARYVQRVLKPSDMLGIAWGGTMYHLIQYLNPCQKIAANFITLHGSISIADYELDVRTLVLRMAMAFGGKHYPLVSEGLLDSPGQIRELVKKDRIDRIFELFNQITISVSGIGSLYPAADSPLSRIDYLTPSELAELRQKGVYGDLVLRFFDSEGQECDSSLKDRTLAIPLDTYRRIPCKVIAASGAQKAYTLRAALKGRLVNVLIVDYSLARAVVHLGA